MLLEGPISEAFGTSRVPVRQALKLLAGDRLIRRFEGRGYLVGRPYGTPPAPLRVPVDREVLGLDGLSRVVDHRPAGERIIIGVHHQLSLARVFGHYTIHESGIASHYGASRTVVREVLVRLRDLGLVEKRPYAQWLTSPLTAVSVTDDYELRSVLEPYALRKAAGHITQAEVQAMIDRVTRLLESSALPTAAELRRVEDDLHVTCLRHARNEQLRSVLSHAQAPLSISEIFYDLVGVDPREALLSEHLTIYGFIRRGAFDAAAACLEAHLREASHRALDRLTVLSVFPEPALPTYLERLK